MRPDLPTGVVTLLFTDIEGSTQLLAELRAGYVEALARHRDTLRTACEQHGGVVVDSTGDAMLMAFARPGDAVQATAEAQRALFGGPVRVRMGLHSGSPEQHDDGYVGIDVHRGARIAAAGHGGQVLLSAATRGLVDQPVADLGLHQLRGLETPERIYQLLIDGVPDSFPPLRTVEADRPALPVWSTSFVGREAELERIASLLGDPSCRIVSIVGPGGAGKTRLAVQAAASDWERHRRRTAYAPLATVTTGDELVMALAQAVGLVMDLAHSAGRPPADMLADFLRERSLLIVADNCEQLVDAAGVFSRLVETAPNVQVLLTSRTRLDLAGEWSIDVAGLAPSDEGDLAARLFVERARQRDPGLSIRDDDFAAISRICRLTEAMPLAIELAAAWMGVLSPTELADELERDLDILAARGTDAPERHRSLRAAFSSSWRLLDEEQRRVLAGLSVFAAPFTREAARSIVDASLSTLAELVSRSLVRRAEERYEMHELVRRYAAEELDRSEASSGLREAHARYFEGRVSSRLERLRSSASRVARDEIQPDLADIRIAAEWAVTHWSSEEVVPLLRGLTAMWVAQVDPVGPPVLRELARAVAEERDAGRDQGAAVPMRTKLVSYLAVSLASIDANRESDAVIDEHLEEVRASGDRWDIATCLLARGMNRDNRDENAEAMAPLQEADALYAELGDDLMRADTLMWLGWAQLMLDDVMAARSSFEESKRCALACGDPVTIAFAESKLGALDDAEGRPAEALRRHLDAFAAFDAAGNVGGIGFCLSRAGLSSYMLGDFRSALDFSKSAFEAFDSLGHRWGSAVAAERIAFAYLGREETAMARTWAMRSLRLVAAGEHARMGRLFALGAMAASYAREGHGRQWLPVLRAIVTDPDMPAVYAVQVQRELDLAEAAAAHTDEVAQLAEPTPAASDLDDIITRLLQEQGVAATAV